jgi:hypothetical protein
MYASKLPGLLFVPLPDQRFRYRCTDPPNFIRESALPFGNPWHGGSWHGPEGRDTGTFNGSTLFQPAPPPQRTASSSPRPAASTAAAGQQQQVVAGRVEQQ